jgi:hypothetical protein
MLIVLQKNKFFNPQDAGDWEMPREAAAGSMPLDRIAPRCFGSMAGLFVFRLAGNRKSKGRRKNDFRVRSGEARLFPGAAPFIQSRFFK